MQKTVYAIALAFFSLTLASCHKQNTEKLAMDNQVPVTGFERTIKIDLEGTRLNVPYGYLAGTSREGATRWPSDEEIVHPVNVFDIYVYPNWDGEKLTLEPFNERNKDKFIKKLKDGLADVDDILIYPKKKCQLNVEKLKQDEIKYGGKQINSNNINYQAYKRVTKNPEYVENYFKKDKNPVWISVRYKETYMYKYHVSVGTCINGISISYYPSIENINKDVKSIQKSVFEYQKQLEKLIQSFIV